MDLDCSFVHSTEENGGHVYNQAKLDGKLCNIDVTHNEFYCGNRMRLELG